MRKEASSRKRSGTRGWEADFRRRRPRWIDDPLCALALKDSNSTRCCRDPTSLMVLNEHRVGVALSNVDATDFRVAPAPHCTMLAPEVGSRIMLLQARIGWTTPEVDERRTAPRPQSSGEMRRRDELQGAERQLNCSPSSSQLRTLPPLTPLWMRIESFQVRRFSACDQ